MSTTQLAIQTVMAGEGLLDINSGVESIAMNDLVILIVMQDGEQVASYQMTVGQAMEIASGLSSAAGRLVNAQVGDDGKPLPIADRFRALLPAKDS